MTTHPKSLRLEPSPTTTATVTVDPSLQYTKRNRLSVVLGGSQNATRTVLWFWESLLERRRGTVVIATQVCSKHAHKKPLVCV